MSLKDSLDVLNWKCSPAAGGGVWIYSYEFKSGKALSDLIDSNGPAWRRIALTVETRSGTYKTPEVNLWNQSFATLPVSGSARASLSDNQKVYYFNTIESGYGFEVASHNIVLVGGASAEYSLVSAAEESDPDLDFGVIHSLDKSFVYLEGSYNAASYSDYVLRQAGNSNTVAILFHGI